MEYHSSAIGPGVLISELDERLRRVEQRLNGGYTRVMKARSRPGDAAMAAIENSPIRRRG
jgi:ribosomal protein L17